MRVQGTPQPKGKKDKYFGIKLWSKKRADDEMSKYIRELHNYTCEVCGKYVEPPTTVIQCSHYIGRKYTATRYLPDNLDCFCASDHGKWEDRKQFEYRDFKIRKIGIERHNELQRLANTTMKEKDAIYQCMQFLGAI